MSLLKRVKNIIKSNLNYSSDLSDTNIDINSYEDIYFEDSKEISEENSVDKKYYDVLGLEYGADFDKIKKAYRILLKKYHPDLFVSDKSKLEIAQKLTQKINEAYNYFERKQL